MRPFAIAGLIVLTGFLAGCGSDPAPSTSSTASTATRYVALGDSNTSGSGLPTPATGAPKNCYRTESGYPTFAAAKLDQDEFQTVACSGAGMGAFESEMALYPDGKAPPQFDALKGNETIVSVTVGVNDVRLGEVAETCLKAKNPNATPCQDKYVSGGKNELTERAESLTAPFGAMLDAIHTKSPKAKVYVVGYGPIIPKDGARCWGKVNVSESDAPYFYGFQESISDAEKAAAEQHDATYVDFFHAGAGHDACQPASKRWSNPENNVGTAGWPIHPTIAGTRAAAAALAKAADGP